MVHFQDEMQVTYQIENAFFTKCGIKIPLSIRKKKSGQRIAHLITKAHCPLNKMTNDTGTISDCTRATRRQRKPLLHHQDPLQH